MRTFVPIRVRRIASMASWTVVDQFLSALSNILLAVLVARTVDAAGFGAFSVAVLVFSLIVGLTRAMVGEPLQITFASAAPDRFRSAVRSALGAALIFGVATGVITTGTGLMLGTDSGYALAALGLCLPGPLVQDTCRMAFFSSGHPRRAAAIDALWAVIVFGALSIVLAVGIHSTWIPILIWGAGATIAALAGFGLLKLLPKLRGAIRWTLGQRRLTGYLSAAFILRQGIGLVGILLVGVMDSQAGVGAIRAAQVLIGPLTILGTAAFMFAVPEIARRPWMSPRARKLSCTWIVLVMSFITSLYCMVLLLLPDAIGQQLFGDSWTGAESVLVAMCVLSISAAIATGPVAVLYGMGLSRITFGVNLIRAPLLIALMLVGIARWGPLGAAWALAVTETILLPLWFLRLRRVLHTRPGTPPVTATLAADEAKESADMNTARPIDGWRSQ